MYASGCLRDPVPELTGHDSPGGTLRRLVDGRTALAEQISRADAERLTADLLAGARTGFRHVGSQVGNDDPLLTTTVRRQIRSAARRGVGVRMLCGSDEVENRVRQRFLLDVAEVCPGGVRVSTARLQGICVVDRHTALTWSEDPVHRDYVLTRSATLIEPLLSLFDSVWGGAVDLPAHLDRGADPGLQPQVLQLLADGLKDDTAARTLGVSVRTYRRHVADVMSRLNARSRFEAGLRAARLDLM